MYRTDDPLADFDSYEWKCERKLHRRPKCDICGEYIQGDYLFDMGGELHCEECHEREYRKDVTDYESR